MLRVMLLLHGVRVLDIDRHIFSCVNTTAGEFMSFEYVAVSLFSDAPVLVIVIYRPPN